MSHDHRWGRMTSGQNPCSETTLHTHLTSHKECTWTILQTCKWATVHACAENSTGSARQFSSRSKLHTLLCRQRPKNTPCWRRNSLNWKYSGSCYNASIKLTAAKTQAQTKRVKLETWNQATRKVSSSGTLTKQDGRMWSHFHHSRAIAQLSELDHRH